MTDRIAYVFIFTAQVLSENRKDPVAFVREILMELGSEVNLKYVKVGEVSTFEQRRLPQGDQEIITVDVAADTATLFPPGGDETLSIIEYTKDKDTLALVSGPLNLADHPCFLIQSASGMLKYLIIYGDEGQSVMQLLTKLMIPNP